MAGTYYNLVLKGIYIGPNEMVSVTHPDESNLI
jgi:hypothetical protein